MPIWGTLQISGLHGGIQLGRRLRFSVSQLLALRSSRHGDSGTSLYSDEPHNIGFQPTVGAPSNRAPCSTRTLRAAGG
jgi:hypothetical protein